MLLKNNIDMLDSKMETIAGLVKSMACMEELMISIVILFAVKILICSVVLQDLIVSMTCSFMKNQMNVLKNQKIAQS